MLKIYAFEFFYVRFLTLRIFLLFETAISILQKGVLKACEKILP